MTFQGAGGGGGGEKRRGVEEFGQCRFFKQG